MLTKQARSDVCVCRYIQLGEFEAYLNETVGKEEKESETCHAKQQVLVRSLAPSPTPAPAPELPVIPNGKAARWAARADAVNCVNVSAQAEANGISNAGTKADRRAARVKDAGTHPTTCTPSQTPAPKPTPTPVPATSNLSTVSEAPITVPAMTKAQKWAARAVAASVAPAAAALAQSAPVASEGGGDKSKTKAARWEARVTGATAVGAAESGAVSSMPAQGQCSNPPASKSLLIPSSHSYVNGNWAMWPVVGSAMEAWLARAAAKRLHLPWAGKCYDFCDETVLQRKGLSVQQIHAQRFHFNPPDLNRTVSV